MIRVVVVDDHPAIIDSVGRALAGDLDIELVGHAPDRSQAAQLIARERPDVVVCDVQMGGGADGLCLLEQLRAEGGPAFIMLSAYDYPSLLRVAFERGAAGYILKTTELSDLVAAVHAVASGGTAFSAASKRVIRRAMSRPSEREIEVLQFLAGGLTNEEIAAQLTLSLKTIESHLRRLFDRYGVMNRTALTVLAIREGWIPRG